MELQQRVAVVTGGASGLGRATAFEFARAGAMVAVLDRDGRGAKAVADEIGGTTIGIEADVADEYSVGEAVRRVVEALGTVHVCLNAAGIPTPGKIVNRDGALPLDQFRRVIDTNLVGLFDVMRRCAELMIVNEPDERGERGVIINVASGAAWQGQRGQSAYAASKAGVMGLTLPVARDLAEHGIRVVAIAPGLFDTGMVGELPAAGRESLVSQILNPRRLGDPVEFAQLARHVAENSYLNATTLSIDAGARMT